MAYSIPRLLKSDCQLGKRLRKICATLDAYNIQGTLELQSASSSHKRLCDQYDIFLVSGAVNRNIQKIYYQDVIQNLVQVENVNLFVSKGSLFHDYLIDQE